MRPAPSMPTTGTAPERALGAALRRLGAPEWEASPRDIAGRPDYLFRHQRVAVFVNGCQWHGCSKHFRPHVDKGSGTDQKQHGLTREAATRRRFQDALLRRTLESAGYRVCSLWSHEVDADAAGCAAKVMEALAR